MKTHLDHLQHCHASPRGRVSERRDSTDLALTDDIDVGFGRCSQSCSDDCCRACHGLAAFARAWRDAVRQQVGDDGRPQSWTRSTCCSRSIWLKSVSRLFVVRLPFPSVAAPSPDVASLVDCSRLLRIVGHATPGFHAQSRRCAVTLGSQEGPVLRDMATGAATHSCGFEGSSRRDRVRVASALAARLVGISRRRMVDLVDAVARVSCGDG